MTIYMNSFSNFQDLNARLLVSCPNDPNASGGLFLIDFGLKNISKILEADCRGLARTKDGYYLATNSHGILQLDHSFSVLNRYDIPALDFHGMKIDEKGRLYIVETAVNAIGIYQTSPFERVDEIKISPYNTDHNHINDICILDDRIYVSMFSISGGWRGRKGAFDGVIAEYDLQSKQLVKVHFDQLQLPHSILTINRKIYFCESLNLSLNEENKTLASLGGYTRGLDHDHTNYYIGQSAMRHLDRILSVVPNVSVDSGIHILNKEDRTSRFFPLPVKQVYEIMVLDRHEEALQTTNEYLYLNQTDAANSGITLSEWHEAEENHRWMASTKATIKLYKNQDTPYLFVNAFSLYPENYKCSIRINEHIIGHLSFPQSGAVKEKIVVDHIEAGAVAITFIVDFLWSPAQSLNNLDQRKLGLAIEYVGFINRE